MFLLIQEVSQLHLSCFRMATLKQLQPPPLSAADYVTYQKYYGNEALQQYYKDYYKQQAAVAGHQQVPNGTQLLIDCVRAS